jgi:hypothetical protein
MTPTRSPSPSPAPKPEGPPKRLAFTLVGQRASLDRLLGELIESPEYAGWRHKTFGVVESAWPEETRALHQRLGIPSTPGPVTLSFAPPAETVLDGIVRLVQGEGGYLAVVPEVQLPWDGLAPWIEACNALATGFVEAVLRPLISRFGLDLYFLTGSSAAPVRDVVSRHVADELEAVAGSKVSAGNLSPEAAGRFRALVARIHAERSVVDRSVLTAWLEEATDWPEDLVEFLGHQLDWALALLAAYDRLTGTRGAR